jgi:hypothetical protein
MAENRSYVGCWIAAAMALIAGPFLLYLFIGGRVQGEEFSPDDFSRRSFSYNVMPIFHFTVQGIYYQDSTPVFEQTLFADGLLGNANDQVSSDKQWHLINDTVSDQRSGDFDARILCRFLNLTNPDSESIWIQWNGKFPKLAAQFWPIIADLARESLYLDISTIMLKATGVTDSTADSFQDFLVRSASRAFLEQGQALQHQNEFERAASMFTRSIEILPSKEAFSGRSDCLRALGKLKLSEQDLQASENL